MVKGAVLSAVIGIPIGALIIWFYYALGDYFWITAWAVMTVFSLFIDHVCGQLDHALV